MFQIAQEIVSELSARVPAARVRMCGHIEKGDLVCLYAIWGHNLELDSEFEFVLGDPEGFERAVEWLSDIVYDVYA